MTATLPRRSIVALALGAGQTLLVLLGWGLDDVSMYFANPARALVVGSVILQPLLFLFVPNFGLPSSSAGEGRGDWLGVLVATVAIPALLFVAPYSQQLGIWNPGAPLPSLVAGSLLVALGAVFATWGPVHLGRQYSVFVILQQEHRLITGGPFRLMQHPRYSGLVQWAVGIALIFGSSPALLLALLLAVVFIRRSRLEERLLKQEFGPHWEAYAKRTKRFVPLLY